VQPAEHRLRPLPAGELTLLNVRSIGRRALLAGLAKRTLAGAPVSIVEAGAVIARTTIRPDGTFRVRVDVPRIRGGRILRYQAQRPQSLQDRHGGGRAEAS
jgi:hypothetical protein